MTFWKRNRRREGVFVWVRGRGGKRRGEERGNTEKTHNEFKEIGKERK
jgi:hypothetical protein